MFPSSQKITAGTKAKWLAVWFILLQFIGAVVMGAVATAPKGVWYILLATSWILLLFIRDHVIIRKSRISKAKVTLYLLPLLVVPYFIAIYVIGWNSFPTPWLPLLLPLVIFTWGQSYFLSLGNSAYIRNLIQEKFHGLNRTVVITTAILVGITALFSLFSPPARSFSLAALLFFTFERLLTSWSGRYNAELLKVYKQLPGSEDIGAINLTISLVILLLYIGSVAVGEPKYVTLFVGAGMYYVGAWLTYLRIAYAYDRMLGRAQ